MSNNTKAQDHLPSQEKPERDVEKGDSSSEDNGNGTGEHLGVKPTENREVKDGKRVITMDECWSKLGYSWPTWKKWMLLSSIFTVQVSMNFNTSGMHSHVAVESMRAG